MQFRIFCSKICSYGSWKSTPSHFVGPGSCLKWTAPLNTGSDVPGTRKIKLSMWNLYSRIWAHVKLSKNLFRKKFTYNSILSKTQLIFILQYLQVHRCKRTIISGNIVRFWTLIFFFSKRHEGDIDFLKFSDLSKFRAYILARPFFGPEPTSSW